MKKICIIIKREFLVQIRQKSFIIVTLFTPIFIIILFLFLSSLYNNDDSVTFYKVGVVDENSHNFLNLKSDKNILFTFLKKKNELKNKNFFLKELNKFDALLLIPKYKEISSFDKEIYLYFIKNNNIDDIINNLNFLLYKKIELLKLKKIGASKNILNLIKNNYLKITPYYLGNTLSQVNNKMAIKFLLISIMMYIIMMFILIYGVRIMRSVFEEKNNRIVEIILSSVKPIELMIGKIFGTGLVALTQFIFWTFILCIISLLFKDILVDKEFYIKNIIEQFSIIIKFIFNKEYLILLSMFLTYFLGGYLLFSAIFAAIGACIEVDSEPQQFSIIASIILLIGFYVGISSFNHPNNILVLILSIFPLTSPVVMLSRLAFNIPIWEISLSIFILFFSVFNVMYLASKIYSMNILVHNKRGFFRKIKL